MNRFRKNILIPLAAFLVISVLFACTSDTNVADESGVELKINFGKGDKYLYTTQVNQKINSFGTQMDQTMLMEMVYSYVGDDGANKKLDITYDHVMISTTSPMGQSRYDSKEAGKKEPEYSFMDNLIGKSFHITVAPNGDILRVDGLKELVASLSGSADESVRQTLESQFSDTAVKLMMQNSFDMYPGKKVKVGESWGKKSVMNFSGMNVNVENTYTLKSVTNGKASVAVVSVMNLPATDMSGSTGMAAQMEMTGKQEGTMEIDAATGQILSGKTTQNIEGKFSTEGQAMPININGDITINSKKQ